MIKFFRKIRRKLIDEGNLKTYLTYAVGEILLVMIGILLALQVNNWNENRKALNQEGQYLNRLLSELRLDTDTFSNEIKKITKRNEQIANFTDLLNKPASDDSLVVAAAYEYFGHGWYLPLFSVSTSTFDDLSNTGKLNIIQNTKLRALLVEQYASYAETKTKFQSNRAWVNSIDARFATASDILKFDPITDQLFAEHSLEKKARQLRDEKEIYIRNAAVHFWINSSSIRSLEAEFNKVSMLIEAIGKELE